MKIGNFLITRDRSGISEESLRSVDEIYEANIQAGKKLVLCVLAGRSGTRWLGDVFNAHKNATGVTERYFEAEAFYRYICYNKLPIDTAGVISQIKYGIIADWKRGDIAFVCSPFFSHGILELYETLKPSRIIFGLNDPKFTVQSMYNKGFFEHYYIREAVDRALGFQPSFPKRWQWLYLFARLVPNGSLYREWVAYTRVGKIAWWANKMNTDIWEQLKSIPPEKIFIFHLKEADQNYEYYKNLAKNFGLHPLLSEKKFRSIKKKTVRFWHNTTGHWSDQEQQEFAKYTKDWYEIYNKVYGKKD